MKALQIVTSFVSIMVYMGTDVYSLDKIRNKRPEVVEQTAKQEAIERKVASEKEAAVAANQDELDKAFITSFPYMTGEYEVQLPSDQRFKYQIQIEPYLVKKGGLDSAGLYANVMINLDTDEQYTSYYKARVSVSSATDIKMYLEAKEISTFMKIDSSLSAVDYFPENLQIKVLENGAWDLSLQPGEYQPFKMVGRMMKTPAQGISRFAGTWSGKVGEYPIKLELKQNGKFLEADYRITMTFPCRFAKASVRLTAENRVSLVGGLIDHTESYSGCVTPLIRGLIAGDGKLHVMHFWRGGETTEGILTQ